MTVARHWRVIPRGQQPVWVIDDPAEMLTAGWEGATVEGPFVHEAPARCQHCSCLADERSFMCEDCASKADEEAQELRDEIERLRRLIGEAYTQRGTRPMQVLRELFGATREQPPAALPLPRTDQPKEAT